MSRKRKKAGGDAPDAEVTSSVPEAVPEDILAEGSGPVQAVAHVAIPTDDQEPDPPVRSASKKKSKRAREAEVAVAPVVDTEVTPEAIEAVVRAEVIEVIEDAEAEGEEPAVRRKGKKSLEEVAQAVEAEPRRRKGKRAVVASLEPSEVPVEAIEAIEAVEAIGEIEEIEEQIEASEESEATEVNEAIASELHAASDGPVADELGDQFVAEGEDLVAAEGEVRAGEAEAATGETETEVGAGAGAETEAEGEGVASLPTSAMSLDREGLKQLVEALVFASDKPMTVQRLRQLTRVSDIPRLEQALLDLAADYADRGIVLQQVSGGYQFRTRTQWSQWVQQLIAGRPVRLTRAQLETLAIVAYRQPITRPEIDDIRGVDSSATLKLLMDRQLIRILGKKEEVGRPMLYGTTKEFLDFFSLGDLRELPTLREYSELTPESRQVITDRLGDVPEGGDGGEGEGGQGGDSGGGGEGADPSDASGLGAAPEPTAADLIAAYVAEIDTEASSTEHVVLDVVDDVEGDAPERPAGDEILTYAAAATSEAPADEADGPVAEPEIIAEDAAHLAEAILAMAPTSEATVDAASAGAELASAGLANDAAELADAILHTPAITDELAFDLSDSDADQAVEPAVVTEVHAGSLVELDPFAAEVPAAVASVGDAFVGESIVDSPELEAAAFEAVDAAMTTGETGEAGEAIEAIEAIEAVASDNAEAIEAVASDDEAIEAVASDDAEAIEAVLAEGSSGMIVEAEPASAAPHVSLDEWPGGSGGFAASDDAAPSAGELPPHGDPDADAATAAADGSDVVTDPVE